MKILIIRLSAIGDIVMASPLVSALQQRFPEAEINWLVQPESAPLLRDHPQIKQVVIWDKNGWDSLRKDFRLIQLSKKIRTFKAEMQAQDYDLVLDCQGLLKSGFLAWLTGAKKRIGLGSKEGSQYLMTEVIDRGGDQDQIGSEYRYLATELGCDTTEFPMQLHTAATATEAATDLLAGLKQVAIISPFTTRPQKHWFNDAWITLTGLLKERGYSVVMLGGPGDLEASQKIAENADVINLVGKTDLPTAVAVIKQAELQVGVDTGLTHMGIAQNLPVVALFGSTRPYLKTDNPLARVIYHDLSCAPCKRKPVCGGAFHCMREITAAEVMTQVQKITTMAVT